jgi:hypothetical protein
MSKAQHNQKPKSLTTSRDAGRVQAAAARSSYGSVPKGSFAARMQAAAARSEGKSGAKEAGQDVATQRDLKNHSNQLNPNNDVYWQSRGWDERPADWETKTEASELLPIPSAVKKSGKA